MVDKVGYTRPVSSTRATKRTSGVASSGFADALSQAEGAADIAAVEATGGLGAVGSLDGLLGLQEVDERESQRRRSVKRGRLTLEALDQLRDALLMGSLPHATIEKLERMVVQEREATTDPHLVAILAEIEVRAAVELAKLEMAGAVPSRT